LRGGYPRTQLHSSVEAYCKLKKKRIGS